VKSNSDDDLELLRLTAMEQNGSPPPRFSMDKERERRLSEAHGDGVAGADYPRQATE
jgi:hypothetical protein